MKKKSKFYLVYVQRCECKVKTFNTENELYKFVAEFAPTMYNNPDNWIDFAFNGEVILMGDNFKVE